jgi:hypothetical protein
MNVRHFSYLEFEIIEYVILYIWAIAASKTWEKKALLAKTTLNRVNNLFVLI